MASVNRFTTEKGCWFLYHLPVGRRRKIFKRLREIDPTSVDRIAVIKRRKTRMKNQKKIDKKKMEQSLAVKRAHEESRVAITSMNYVEEGVTQFSFIEADSILDIIAMLMCAGYEKKEIKKKFPKLDIKLIEQVDNARIQKMKRRVPDAIIDAADKKVLKNLIDGEVDGSTTKADLIAHRRRKINLEAAKFVLPDSKSDPAKEREKRDKLKERFGYKPKTIDVTPEEIKNEDNEA